MKTTSLRTLVFAPRGRDGELAVQLLSRHQVEAELCASGEALLARIAEGAGCAVLTEDALEPELQRELARLFEEQPPWSDFPLIVLASANGAHQLQTVAAGLGNVTAIERPVAPETVLTSVRAALRARRRQYEACVAIQQRDQFLAMLGHELRTPLGAIVLATELERNSRDRSQLDERLAVISRQSKLLARLVDDLLDVARVTTGKIVLRNEPVEIDSVIAGSVQAHRERARVRSIDLLIERTSGAQVDGDPVRLEQVLNNLLSNAIKYSPARRSVHVSSAIRGDQCEIRVRDKGMGIAPEMQARVFDLFAQADGSLGRAEGGLGIGLTLVDRLVRLHGGSVTVESAGVGHGSEFVVTLPLGRAEPTNVIRIESARKGSQLQVALVEDNADLRELTAALLEAQACEVAVAADGPEGVDLIVKSRPELALVDIGLPTLDGFQVARRVRTQVGDGVMLVAITGYGRDQDHEAAMQAGFDAFYVKPLSFDSVRAILDRARARSAAQRSQG
ncbi:MAG TPA: hybrid sensor histidine kinase/response regulator [Kofleriaceae bacterium]|nr:hybrid sensor histidine kinase/response regulator [Kofleriaceae bacterium]